jgi:hypothetical protein
LLLPSAREWRLSIWQIMRRRRFHLVLAAQALLASASVPGACGGERAASRTPAPLASASASSPAESASATHESAPANGLPPAPAAPSAAFVAPTPTPTSAVASARTNESWAPCHQSFKPTAHDVAKDVAALAKGCEAQTKMKLVGKTLLGKQADQDTPQTFPLDAKANHCYRIYAQAAEGIRDLDLAVKDSAGVVVGQDSTDDSNPVVLEDGAVCFTKDDKATVVVSVGMGSGAYAVQIWGD